MTIFKPLLTSAAAAALVAAFGLSNAQSSASAEIVRATIDGHACQTGGYGVEQVATMKRDQGSYNLRMTFSEGEHDQFVAALKLRIKDAAGNQVFAYDDAGPLTDVDLPAGSYRVVAEYGGVQRSGNVHIGPGAHADLNLHWPAEVG
jgi:hypothetical protein